jgi:hypothetical protein
MSAFKWFASFVLAEPSSQHFLQSRIAPEMSQVYPCVL